ncbi:hypothetical protein ACWDRB_08065 [Nonomuraea sp. NPDC003707]
MVGSLCPGVRVRALRGTAARMAASVPINDDVTLNVDTSDPADPLRQPFQTGNRPAWVSDGGERRASLRGPTIDQLTVGLHGLFAPSFQATFAPGALGGGQLIDAFCVSAVMSAVGPPPFQRHIRSS